MKQFVYDFTQGRMDDKALLGGKGANLAEMTHLGLPVPAGFTVTTECCMMYLANNELFDTLLKGDLLKAIHRLEHATQKSFTAETNLLLVSVRSGAAFSMPGMMDTILNLGLNDQRVASFAQETNLAFAFDCYRRLLQMYGDVVFGIPKEAFNQLLDQQSKTLKKQATAFSLAENQQVIQTYHQLYAEHDVCFPQNPYDQLFGATRAVFHSWNNQRAQVYRDLHQIPHDLGTAVNVQAMVFGNSGDQSGTGVVFTRNPATGETALFGEFLLNAQGEDVVAGIRTPEPIATLKTTLPQAYEDFVHYAQLLEKHYQDMQDIEFTIEHGKLFILQTRNGKRTAKAALAIAENMVAEGLISKQEALLRIEPNMIEQLIHPVFNQDALKTAPLLATGLPASPGAATGMIVFTAQAAKAYHQKGEAVILVRQETSPEDIEGMIVSQAIVTSRGGMTSHAAVVARGMGTCCVTGCEALQVEEETKVVICGDQHLHEGDIVSVDGNTGRIYFAAISTTLPEHNHELTKLLDWADEEATLTVRANAETLTDLQTAIDFGATGIGLARTEHMFFGAERVLEMRRLILAETVTEKQQALTTLMTFQQADFYHMFQTVNDKPLVIRLLDPPLHEFVPQEAGELANLAKKLGKDAQSIERQIKQLHETNPMLGHRGCRLGVTTPEIYQMQATAIMKSAIQLAREGQLVVPEMMIPLIAEKNELVYLKQLLVDTIETLFEEEQMTPFPYEIGTMIELPRACLVADQLAEEADFFSFGTNDLTQMTYGFSRDDIGKFITTYTEKDILPSDPFQHLDQNGVGALMQLAIEKARRTAPELLIGVCGEVGGDPQSIQFLQQIGVDYISCSPYRVPAARLAAAQAALKQRKTAVVTH